MSKRIIAILLVSLEFVIMLNPLGINASENELVLHKRVFTIDVFAENAEVDEASGTAVVYMDVSNNLGLYDLAYEIVYPKCLTLVSAECVYNAGEGFVTRFNHGAENTNVGTFADCIDQLNADPYALLGADPLHPDDAPDMKWAICYLSTYKRDDDTVFAKDNGRIVKYSFKYDASQNESAYLPIIVLPKKSGTGSGVIGGRDLWVYPEYNYRFYGANIAVPSLENECNHRFVLTEIEPVNCYSLGVRNYKCEICNAEKNVTTFYGHSYVANYKEATCTKGSYREEYCEICDEIYYDTSVGIPLGHKFSEEYHIDVQPSKDSAGSRSRHCTVCGEKTDIEEVVYLPGDVNGDGKLNLSDLPAMKRALTSDDNVALVNIDVNDDGKYTLTDLAALKKLLA